MIQVDSRLVMGATLFGAPGVKGGDIQMSGPVCVLILLVVAFVGLMLYQHGPWRPGPDPNPGDGWGKGPPPPDSSPPDRPPGGIPLDDAAPARVRLRGENRLADKLPARERRQTREPDRTPCPTRRPGVAHPFGNFAAWRRGSFCPERSKPWGP
jgi:hypothetical protein